MEWLWNAKKDSHSTHFFEVVPPLLACLADRHCGCAGAYFGFSLFPWDFGQLFASPWPMLRNISGSAAEEI